MKKWISILTAALILAAAVSAVSAGGTLAYIAQRTGRVENRFGAAGEPGVEVTECFDGTVKTDVAVKNTGSVAGYIRCEVVVSLLNEDGTVAPVQPVPGRDYSITYSGGWIYGVDGYWYYPRPVPAGGSTDVLIRSCESLCPDYHLSVTVLAQLVQATPGAAATDAWGVTRDDAGTIRK